MRKSKHDKKEKPTKKTRAEIKQEKLEKSVAKKVASNEAKAKKKKQKAKKKAENKVALKNISYKNLSREIAGYGYEYSFKSYVVQMVVVLLAIAGTSYFYQLHMLNALIVLMFSIIVMPAIIIAQFRYLSNNDRFEQVVNYLDQMIISFKQTPKILFAMRSTTELLDGKMKECVLKAIDIIENDSTSVDVYDKAFEVIESEFRCSRIHTLHRFILNVEKENSVNYQESIDNLYFDVRSWVTRTYQYQADLGNTKKKIVIILALSLGIAAFFTHVLETAQSAVKGQYTFNVLDGGVYQSVTTIFLITFIMIYMILNSKINGQWLVNDIDNKKEELVIKDIEYLSNYDAKREWKHSIIASMFGVVLLIIGLFMHKQPVIVAGVVFTIILLMKGKMSYKARKKNVEKELVKEFPIWMRDIAINLNNMVVIRAVDQSYENASPIMKVFLKNFLAAVDEEPNSIKPYLNFLGMYNVSELSTAFKTLYSIRILSREESQRQINDLITRNQTLLEASEKMRNEDAVAGVSFVSMLPMILLSLKLMVDLGLMLGAFLGMTNGML